ncbi:hypothetical protein FA95DRAFT_221928 [Auriscalpium vulgare]|uniref:Uncharacterized protein n=1 Tax=Auriscalpium vulgare TaxID=40419 RepID=A0ACB8RKI8_9AGAM|nr:hypothetical protein FA95DRAFT_221928 [Auriscalpium vulgare]
MSIPSWRTLDSRCEFSLTRLDEQVIRCTSRTVPRSAHTSPTSRLPVATPVSIFLRLKISNSGLCALHDAAWGTYIAFPTLDVSRLLRLPYHQREDLECHPSPFQMPG